MATSHGLLRTGLDMASAERAGGVLAKGAVNTVTRDSRGRIWAALWDKGLFVLDPKGHDFEKLPEIGQHDSPMRILELENGRMVCSTWGDGIFAIDRNPDGRWVVRSLTVARDDAPGLGRIYGMAAHGGCIWAIGDKSITAFDITADSIRTRNLGDLPSHMNNVYSNIIATRDGGIWVSTFSGGVWRINAEDGRLRRYRLLAGASGPERIAPFVNRMYVADDGRIWFNQNRRGLGIYDPATGKTSLYPDIPGLDGVRELGGVGCILPGSDGEEALVVSRYGKTAFRLRHEGEGVRITRRTDLSGTDSGNITDGCVASDSRVWLCGPDGIVMFGEGTAPRTMFGGIKDFTYACAGKEGRVWLTTATGGLMTVVPERLDRTHVRFRLMRVSGTEKMSIRGLDVDPESGAVWIVNHFGEVWRCDASGRLEPSPRMGLGQGSGGTPVALGLDDDGSVWVATHRALTEYDPATGRMVNYSDAVSDDGVNALVETALSVDRRGGRLYFGGNGGVASIETRSDSGFRAAPPLVTDVTADGVSLLRDSSAGEFDSARRRITLPPDARNVRLYFSTLDIGSPGKVRYQFRMKGVDRDWQNAGEFANSAFFNMLPAGTYDLELRACGPDGQWTPDPVSYEVVKRPWWYQTWWAITAYVAAALLAAFFICRAYIRHKRVGERLRETEMGRRNAEDLARLKLRYVANVSHDFLTPVSIIGCVADEIERGEKGVSASQLSAIRENLRKIRRLVEEALDIRSLDRDEMRLELKCGASRRTSTRATFP